MALTISEWMTNFPAAFSGQAASCPDVIVQFHFSGREAGDWVLEVKAGVATVVRETHVAPQVTLSADSDDCLKVFTGELDPTQAFLQGKIRFWGDVALLMRIVQMLQAKDFRSP